MKVNICTHERTPDPQTLSALWPAAPDTLRGPAVPMAWPRPTLAVDQ